MRMRKAIEVRSVKRFIAQNGVAIEALDWDRIAIEVNAKDMSDQSQTKVDLSVLSFPLRKRDVVFRKNARAKRYILRINNEGKVQVTVPKYGTQRDALDFANEHRDWIERERKVAHEARRDQRELREGDAVFFKGEPTRLCIAKDWGRPVLIISSYRRFIADENMDLTRPVTDLLREVASEEIPQRVRSLSDSLGLDFERVVIRNQRTRWGSCSSTGVISLNWRLIMMPAGAMDYVIIHELMHLREMNHSDRFWRWVENACPDYRTWIDWLDSHGLKLIP